MIGFKNSKGFTMVEALLIILILSFLGFAGWFVYNENNKNDIKPMPENNQTTGSRVEFKKVGFSIDNKYGWEVSDETKEEPLEGSDVVLASGEITFDLRNGTTLEFRAGTAGFGGMCEPEPTDKFHGKAQCFTNEMLSKEKVTSTKRMGETYDLWLYHRYMTTNEGEHHYSLCLRDFKPEDSNLIKINEPEFSIGVPCVFSTPEADIFMDINGIDDSTKDFFEKEDVKKIEEILKTIRMIQE